MKPDIGAHNVLRLTRQKAKLFELRIPEADHPEIGINPQSLFLLTVGLLGDLAAGVAANFIGDAFPGDVGDLLVADAEEWDSGDARLRDTDPSDLRFVARYFDAFLDARFNIELSVELSILCSAAYELAGSPGSAKVVADKIQAVPPQVGEGLAYFVKWLVVNDLSSFVDSSPYSMYIGPLTSALSEFYQGTIDIGVIITICSDWRKFVYNFGSSIALLYTDIAIAIIEGRLKNSSRTLLPPASGLDLAQWLSVLKKAGFPRQLWISQQRLCDAGLLKGASAVVQMPTSAGKTRAIELALRSAFMSERTALAVIVAPYRSLCHDIRGDVARAFTGEEIVINEVTESYRFDTDLDEIHAVRTILIVTPEKLLYLIRRTPEFADRIGLIVYDEGHQFDGLSRGPTYELLLSTLKILLKDSTQVIFISAVLSNASEISHWLLGENARVVDQTGMLPSVRSIAFASWAEHRGHLVYVSPQDPDDREFYIPSVVEQQALLLRGREVNKRLFPDLTGPEIGLHLGLKLCPNGTVAIFCGRKSSASKLCRTLADIGSRGYDVSSPARQGVDAELRALTLLSELHLGADAPATKAVKIGVLQHHANVPHGLRLSVEYALKTDAARIVVCTSTLAQGVNFPIKYLIVTTVQQGKERILVRDFHNLMGRAGRAGMHTEGGVIFTSPDIYRNKSVQSEMWRWIETKRLLDYNNAEPCGSAILSILDDYVQQPPGLRVQVPLEVYSRLVFGNLNEVQDIVISFKARLPSLRELEFKDFLVKRSRAIHGIASYLASHGNFDSIDNDERTQVLVENTLAFHLAGANERIRLRSLFSEVSAIIIAHEQFEERKVLLRSSSLPPTVVFELYTWVKTNTTLLQGKIDTDVVWAAISDLVVGLLDSKSIKSLSDTTNVEPAMRLWMKGHSFVEIFDLFKVDRVKIGRNYLVVDDIVSMCESAFGFDAAMIVSTLADLAKPLDPDVSSLLSELHSNLRYGLPDRSARAFYEAGFADRVVCQRLSARFPDVLHRRDIRYLINQSPSQFRASLENFPAYFNMVANEISA